jgi:K+-transporting ATPase KdpF subunit
MNLWSGLYILLSSLLAVYLLVALLWPEKFQ